MPIKFLFYGSIFCSDTLSIYLVLFRLILKFLLFRFFHYCILDNFLRTVCSKISKSFCPDSKLTLNTCWWRDGYLFTHETSFRIKRFLFSGIRVAKSKSKCLNKSNTDETSNCPVKTIWRNIPACHHANKSTAISTASHWCHLCTHKKSKSLV